MVVTLIFLAVLIGGMVIGMPIAQSLILTGVALMWHLDFFDTQLLAQNLQAGFDNFPLLAVPFFILAGELMNAGGLSRRIIDLARAFVGHIPGGGHDLSLVHDALGRALCRAALEDEPDSVARTTRHDGHRGGPYRKRPRPADQTEVAPPLPGRTRRC